MIDAADDDPRTRVDALIAAIGPALGCPVTRREVVVVVGPCLAGVSGVVAALRKRLPRFSFVESTDLPPAAAPMGVVFVVSAVAPLTSSDCALLDGAAAATDVVIGVVSKIDVHRTWRDVLQVNYDTLAAHAPRYRRVPWVGVAAAPRLGPQRVDGLVVAIGEQLADPVVDRRNCLRATEARLEKAARRYDGDAEGAGRRARVEAVCKRRSEVLRQRRVSKSERTMALRSEIRRARVQLSYFARNRCASLRSELQAEAASLTRRNLPGFEAYARGRIGEVVTEVTNGTTAQLAAITAALGLPGEHFSWARPCEEPPAEIPASPSSSRRLETRLMMLLGAGFGLGVSLTLSRLFAGIAHGLTAAGIVAGAAIGLTLMFWVVSIRGLLHDRAMLDRWAGEGTAALRSAMQQLVATRLVAVESALSAAQSERDEAEDARVADLVGAIDNELREHAVAAARAAAVRDREMPTLQAALDKVRAELGNLAKREEEGTTSPRRRRDGTEMALRCDDGRGELDQSDSMKPANCGF